MMHSAHTQSRPKTACPVAERPPLPQQRAPPPSMCGREGDSRIHTNPGIQDYHTDQRSIDRLTLSTSVVFLALPASRAGYSLLFVLLHHLEVPTELLFPRAR